MVRIAVLVERVERLADAGAVARRELRERHRHLQREFLADIAQVEMHLRLRPGGMPQARACLRRHLAVDLRERREIDRGEIGIERADEIVALVREQHAERGEVRGEERHHHLRDVQFARDCDHVQGARAARRHQGEVARIVALRDRDLAHGQRHLGDRDLDDRLRRRHRVEPEGLGDFRVDAPQRTFGIELHLPAQKIIRIEAAKDHVGVGDGGLAAAAAIADGPGIGARALRSDLERAHVVAPGDRAAAGADLDHVDHRQHHRVAAGIATDVVARRHHRLAVPGEARLGGGAAHVEGDDARLVAPRYQSRAGDDAGGRAGFDQRRRALHRRAQPHDAAAGMHHLDLAGDADRGQPRRQRAGIVAHDRADIGVHHRGRHALELAILAQDLVREREIGIRQRGADHLASDALVLGIDVGVQEAHRHRLDVVLGEHAAGVRDAGAIERHVRLARAQQTLIDLARELARHQRPMAVKEQVVGLGPVAAADDVDVAGAAGDDEPGLGPFALDQRVDRDGRAVDQLVDGGGRKSALADAVDDALHEMCGGGQALGLDEPSGRVVEPDQVGEGAPDVDRDDDHADLPPLSGRQRRPIPPSQATGFAAK